MSKNSLVQLQLLEYERTGNLVSEENLWNRCR